MHAATNACRAAKRCLLGKQLSEKLNDGLPKDFFSSLFFSINRKKSLLKDKERRNLEMSVEFQSV